MHMRSGIFFTAAILLTFSRKSLVTGNLNDAHILIELLVRSLRLTLDIDLPARQLGCKAGILPFLANSQ